MKKSNLIASIFILLVFTETANTQTAFNPAFQANFQNLKKFQNDFINKFAKKVKDVITIGELDGSQTRNDRCFKAVNQVSRIERKIDSHYDSQRRGVVTDTTFNIYAGTLGQTTEVIIDLKQCDQSKFFFNSLEIPHEFRGSTLRLFFTNSNQECHLGYRIVDGGTISEPNGMQARSWTATIKISPVKNVYFGFFSTKMLPLTIVYEPDQTLGKQYSYQSKKIGVTRAFTVHRTRIHSTMETRPDNSFFEDFNTVKSGLHVLANGLVALSEKAPIAGKIGSAINVFTNLMGEASATYSQGISTRNYQSSGLEYTIEYIIRTSDNNGRDERGILNHENSGLGKGDIMVYLLNPIYAWIYDDNRREFRIAFVGSEGQIQISVSQLKEDLHFLRNRIADYRADMGRNAGNYNPTANGPGRSYLDTASIKTLLGLNPFTANPELTDLGQINRFSKILEMESNSSGTAEINSIISEEKIKRFVTTAIESKIEHTEQGLLSKIGLDIGPSATVDRTFTMEISNGLDIGVTNYEVSEVKNYSNPGTHYSVWYDNIFNSLVPLKMTSPYLLMNRFDLIGKWQTDDGRLFTIERTRGGYYLANNIKGQITLSRDVFTLRLESSVETDWTANMNSTMSGDIRTGQRGEPIELKWYNRANRNHSFKMVKIGTVRPDSNVRNNLVNN